jgi:polyisoprenoid-binding protein YceI
MKKSIYGIGLMLSAGLIIASCTQSGGTKTNGSGEANALLDMDALTVNLDSSKISWSGEMIGIYTHSGLVDLTRAELTLNDGKITGGNFTVDMNSIMPTDKNYNPEEGSTPEKLVGHLQSPDFFDVQNFPEANFVLSRVTDSTATGNLTIRGITGEETIENLKIEKQGNLVKITGDLVIKRKAYNVSWDHPVKDKILNEKIKVGIELIAS